MTITVNTRAYTADRVQPDSVSFTGPANSVSTVDTLVQSRAYPKPQGTFKGVAKPAAKFTKTVSVNAATGETAPLIGACSFSVPVGTPDADVDTLCADLVSYFGLPSTKLLLKKLAIQG